MIYSDLIIHKVFKGNINLENILKKNFRNLILFKYFYRKKLFSLSKDFNFKFYKQLIYYIYNS